MLSNFRIRVVCCENGERLPMLLRRDTGEPLHLANLFAISRLRNSAYAANSVEATLHALALFQTFLEAERIDLESRVRTGEFLSIPETEALSEFVRRRASRRDSRTVVEEAEPAKRKVVSLEAYRSRTRPQEGVNRVSGAHAANRLRAITAFVKWLADFRTGELARTPAHRREYLAISQAFVERLAERTKRRRYRLADPKEGLSRSQLATLFKVIDPLTDVSPWRDPLVRLRNQLIVLWALLLGPRRGELLGARVSDFDFRQNEFRIVRRPDAPDDPRRRQPLVKTAGRLVLVHDALMELTHVYVVGARRSLSRARTHPFLFVDMRRGMPLSHSGFTKVFSTLQKHPDLTRLTGHLLRHTWNDHFSELMEAHQVRAADEEKFRSYVQGWTEGSGTAATYTRRYVRERAREASLTLQRLLLDGRRDEK